MSKANWLIPCRVAPLSFDGHPSRLCVGLGMGAFYKCMGRRRITLMLRKSRAPSSIIWPIYSAMRHELDKVQLRR